MFKVLLGTWALAGVLTSGLLTAVAQNPPPPPDEVTQESQPAAEARDESSAIDRQDDDVPREGDTTQLEQEAEREQRQQSPPPADETSDSAASDNDKADQAGTRSEPAESKQPLPGTTNDATGQLGIQFRTSNSGQLMVSSVNGGRENASALREGDVIVSAGGRTFESEPALREFIMREAEQNQIPFVVMRDGREMTVTWNREQVRDLAGTQANTENGGTEERQQNAVRQASIGAVIVNSRFGPQIADVVPGSPAEQAGLQPGDYIIRMNDQPYASSSRLAADVARSSLDEAITLEIARGGQTMTIEAQPKPYEVVYDRTRNRQQQSLAQNERAPGGTQQTAARPDFELSQRVEELEGQIEDLQKDLQQLRNRMNAVLGDEPGAETPDSETGAEHGGEQTAPAVTD